MGGEILLEAIVVEEQDRLHGRRRFLVTVAGIPAPFFWLGNHPDEPGEVHPGDKLIIGVQVGSVVKAGH